MMHIHNALGQPIGHAVSGWTPPAPPTPASLAGRFCEVAPLEIERHAEDLYAAYATDADQRVWTYLAYGPFDNVAGYIDWMRRTCGSDDPLFVAIIDHARAKAVGVASYLRIQPAAGSIEVGHVNFSPRLQRTPIATEAMYLMMRHAFALGYRRYEWKCDALNASSRAAAQRLGFSFEGVFRQAAVYKGRNRDTAWYAVIDQEWPALEAAFQQWLDPGNFDERGQQHVRLSTLTAPILVQLG